MAILEKTEEIQKVRNRRKPTTALSYLQSAPDDPKDLNISAFEIFTPKEDWYLIYNDMSFSKASAFDLYTKIKDGDIPGDKDLKVKREIEDKYFELVKQRSRKKRLWLLASWTLILLMGALAFLLIK